MRIAYITAGAAGMYCGSCMRDNTLVAALARQGHDALLVPTYTPIRTDEDDVSLFKAVDVLAVVMHHRIVQRIDTLEIFGIQDVLGTNAPRGCRAQISLEQLHHGTNDRQARDVDLLALALQPKHQVLFQQGEEHDAGRLLDFIQHPVELFLAAHQRIDVFDRRNVGVLGGHRACHGDQGFTGRVGNQMKVKIVT